MLRSLLAGLALTVLGGLLIGCDSKDPNAQVSNDPGKAETKPEAPKASSPPKGDVAVVETTLGTIKFLLLDNKAPKTVSNFERLADKKLYDGTAFHRVIPGFMIQGGDPDTKTADKAKYGQGGPGYNIEDEFGDTDFVKGVVAMADTGAPNSAGSQFFIMVGANPGLNGKYTVFGNVTEGQDVADKLVQVKTNGEMVANINDTRVKSIKIIHAAGH